MPFWIYSIVCIVALFGFTYGIYRRLTRDRVEPGRESEKARELEEANYALNAAYYALNRSHRRLKAAQNRLVQAEKMASLGQLTAGIAHEMKNPLNFITNFADVTVELVDELRQELESRPKETVEAVLPDVIAVLDDLRASATRIHEHGRRADGIVRSMLDHTHGTSSAREVIDLNALLDQYVNMVYHGTRARHKDFQVEIEQDLDSQLRPIQVAPQEIGRVLINILDNAFYAVRDRQTAEPSFQPRVHLQTRQRDDVIEIRISDNGPGIPESLLDKVFEPFVTTKPTGVGTGLGLSISYQIITQGHDGDLQVRSAEGEGSTFIIRLPLSPREGATGPINTSLLNLDTAFAMA